MHPALKSQQHRPWQIPTAPWTWRQSWYDLLFVHYPVPAAQLRHLVPEPLKIQEFEGSSWIGIVPFRMAGVMLRLLPDLPWISAFPELNVRLYVEHNGKPGVWFLSLDATNPLAVWAARRFFHLPYKNAAIEIKKSGTTIDYRAMRKEQGDPAELTISYEPTSLSYEAKPETLEHFLTERYCLYAQSPRGFVYCAEVHHRPWPLQSARAEISKNTLLEQYGIELPTTRPVLHYSDGVDVVVWGLKRV